MCEAEGGTVAGGRDFDPAKFNELVLLLVNLSVDDPRLSRVKLNKLLYRSDFEAFRLLGHSITGATYVHGEHGPMAAELPFAEERLGERGYLSYRTEQAGPYPQKMPVAHEGADETQFSDDELAIAKVAVEELRDYGGKAASDWSHEESAGWRLTNDDETIPYDTAIIASEPAPDKTLERLRQRVISGNWK
jgi:Protein of unknown function (DUF4065)